MKLEARLKTSYQLSKIKTQKISQDFVFRSNKYIYAQIIDQDTGLTITGITSKIIENFQMKRLY